MKAFCWIAAALVCAAPLILAVAAYRLISDRWPWSLWSVLAFAAICVSADIYAARRRVERALAVFITGERRSNG